MDLFAYESYGIIKATTQREPLILQHARNQPNRTTTAALPTSLQVLLLVS